MYISHIYCSEKSMTLIEQVYYNLLEQKLVSFEDIVETTERVLGREVKNKYAYRTYVYPLLRNKKLTRIRRGLYVASLPKKANWVIGSRLTIASKLSPSGFLGYMEALEYYGASHAHYFLTHLCVPKSEPFRKFSYRGYRFEPLRVRDIASEIVTGTLEGTAVRVSSRERTFLDCLAHPERSAGWEDTYKSLWGLRGVDFQRLCQLLVERDGVARENGRDAQTLIRRTGLILEMLEADSPYFKDAGTCIDRILDLVEGHSRYIMPRSKGFYIHGQHYVSSWNLIIPKHFEILLRGPRHSFTPLYSAF